MLNKPAVAWSAIVSIALKVEDNVLDDGASHCTAVFYNNQSSWKHATYLAEGAKCPYHKTSANAIRQALGFKDTALSWPKSMPNSMPAIPTREGCTIASHKE